ncbi:MAG: CHAT domain-containing protein [Nitrospirae bacterium]|nr:CHAT domain-containing protein [Nitrospirota bacterium]
MTQTRPFSFIDREAETKLVLRAIQDAKDGKRQSATFINLYGLAGIGKTALLNKIRSEVPNGVISTMVNWQTLGGPGRGMRLNLMEILLNQLVGSGQLTPLNFFEEINVARTKLPLVEMQVTPPEIWMPVTERFIEYLKDYLSQNSNVLLLIFDDTERIDRRTFTWLNKEIFVELTALSNLVVILAGRKRLDSEQLSPALMATKPTYIEIEPFSLEHTREQLGGDLASRPYVAEVSHIYSLTHGHISSNRSVIRYLGETEPERGTLDQHQVEIAQRIRTEMIERILETTNKEWRSVIELVAYPRRFDADLLPALLDHFNIKTGYDLSSTAGITTLIAELINHTSVVEYSRGEEGYKLDGLLAKMITTSDLYLNETLASIIHDTDFHSSTPRFIDAHSFLFDWWLKLTKKQPLKIRDFGDAFYHFTQALRGKVFVGEILSDEDALKQLRERFSDELAKRFSTGSSESVTNLERLKDHLKSDSELDDVLRGAQNTMLFALKEFTEAVKPAPRAQIALLYRRPTLDVTLHLPDQPTLPQSRTTLNKAALPEVGKIMDELGGDAPSPSCQRMFELCLPQSIQEHLRDIKIPLEIITNYANPPWELMFDRKEYLCLRLSLGRLPVMERQPRLNDHPAQTPLRFLFVADPKGDLKGAREEVKVIAKMLRGKADVVVLQGKDATSERVSNCLIGTEGVFDVIHYAGHAAFNIERPMESVLHLHDEDMYAEQIERLLGYRPLVFMNACEASKEQSGEYVGGYLGSFTEGLATSFLLGGARGCIGPMWPVQDGAAKELASYFYAHVVGGKSVGEALRLARVQSCNRDPKNTIWASYILHGDPTVALKGSLYADSLRQTYSEMTERELITAPMLEIVSMEEARSRILAIEEMSFDQLLKHWKAIDNDRRE